MNSFSEIILASCFLLLLKIHPVLSADDTDVLGQNSAVQNLDLQLNRSSLNPLYETESLTTEFNITGTIDDGYSLSVLIDDERIAVVAENATVELPDGVAFFQGSFSTEGRRLGLGLLSFYLHPTAEEAGGENSSELLSEFQVVVLRRS